MEIPKKLIKEALQRIGFDKEDYLKISSEFKPETFITYLHLAFAVGYDKGMNDEKRKHANNMSKAVVQIDKYGNEVQKFNSCTDAGRAVDKAKNTIARAAKLNSKCAGYYWRFV